MGFIEDDVSRICKDLYSKGWFYVGDSTTGLMYKNQCLFVLDGSVNLKSKDSFEYPEFVDVRDLFESKESCFSEVPLIKPIVYPKRCNYHVERFGWLLGKGMLPDLGTESYYSTIESINAISEMSILELNKIKTRETYVERRKVKYTPVKTEPNFVVGSYFMANASEVSGILNMDVVYKLYAIDQENQLIIVKAMNSDYTKERRIQDIEIAADAFVTMAQNKLIATVVLDESFEDSREAVWISPNDENAGLSVTLPEEIRDVCTSSKQEYYCALAYEKCLNLSALLISGMSEDFYKAVYTQLERGVDLAPLVQCEFQEEYLLLLLGLMSYGFDISDVIKNKYSLGEFKDILNENEELLREKAPNLGVSGEVLNLVSNKFYYSDDLSYLSEKRDNLQYVWLCWCNSAYPNFIYRSLLNGGFIGDDSIYVMASNLNRSQLLGMCRELFASVDVHTSNSIEDIVANVNSIYFKNGLLIFGCKDYSFSFDSNSFFIIRNINSMECSYRKILIGDGCIEEGSLSI